MIEYPADLQSPKPHRGRITDWTRWSLSAGRYVITGLFLDHYRLGGHHGHTSYVIKHEGDEIETRNSRYTLVGPERKADEP